MDLERTVGIGPDTSVKIIGYDEKKVRFTSSYQLKAENGK
jgi:DNA uptake protein ComE-like DNA-binding protein